MKNTKIMAVLVVLLAAMLFAGSVTAGEMSEQDFKNVTTNVTGDDIIAYLDEPLSIEIHNTSALIDTDNVTVTVYWGNGASTEVDLEDSGTKYNVTASYTYPEIGTYSITLQSGAVSKEVADVTVYRNLTSQDDAFVYEHIVVDGSDSPSKLIKYSEGTNPTAVNIISSDENGVFYLTESVVNGQYGTYYYSGTPSSTNTDYIYIWYPEISLQAELADSPGDSIDGTTITRDTQVSFLINSPKVAPAMGAVAKIVFTTPSGGTTTAFGGVNSDSNDCSDIELEGTQTAVDAMFVGSNAEAGLWTAQAEYVTSPFNPYAAKSNTIKFTVQSSTLTLTAAKDSIIRSNSFTVTIQGEAKTPYVIYLDNAEASDNAPTLTPDQSGYKGPVTSIKSPQSTAATTVYGGAVFETNAAGQRVVQYDTTGDTKDKSYTVKVNALKEAFTNNGLAVIDPSTYDTVKVKVEIGAVTMSASGDGTVTSSSCLSADRTSMQLSSRTCLPRLLPVQQTTRLM